jgi:hypothetical protein
MDKRIVNITNVFWPLVEGIVLMSYDDIRRTRFFDVMQRCMMKEQTFYLEIDGSGLFLKDLNELFYGTRDYLLTTGDNERHQVLNAAINKMERIIEENEVCESLMNLNMSATSAVDQLNSILDRLVI